MDLQKSSFGNLREQLSYGWSSGLISDIVINLIFPYPGWDYIIVPQQVLNQYSPRVPYFVSSWLLIIMVLRIRTINVYQSEKFFSDLYSQTICQLHGVKQSKLYMIKMILVQNPKAFVFILLTVSTSIQAFLLLIFEYPYL